MGWERGEICAGGPPPLSGIRKFWFRIARRERGEASEVGRECREVADSFTSAPDGVWGVGRLVGYAGGPPSSFPSLAFWALWRREEKGE